MRPRAIALVAGLALVLGGALAGCSSSDGIAGQFKGDQSNYVSGDGSTVEIAPADRKAAVNWSATAIDGSTISSRALAGSVYVVNFWYAGCPPCRAEAKDLEAVYGEVKDEGVQFVGVNTEDGASTAQAFLDDHGITYPTVLDRGDNTVHLAFARTGVPPNAVPTTIVVDRDGRVAARISGELQDRSILSSMIDTVLQEKK